MDQNEEVNSINSDLIRGHIDTIILKALQAGDRYGYDIIKEIEHKSGGQYIIKQPTLYSCLKRLEVQGFVKSYWGTKSIGGRKKYFTLTDMGRDLFLRNKSDWDYSRDVINRLISDDEYTPNYPEQNVTPVENEVSTVESENLNETALEETSETFNASESEISENENYNDSPIIVGDDYIDDVKSVSSEPIYEQMSMLDSLPAETAEEPTIAEEVEVPLSNAEQNHNEIDSIIDDDNIDFIDKVYGEQSQESYLSNVGNAKYEPPQNNDIVDINDYFTDINEDEYSEEEAAASVVDQSKISDDSAIILPPPEEKQRNVQGDDAKILPPQNNESESKTVDFYAYDQSISDFNDASSILDKEYRTVIDQLISNNIIDSTVKEPVQEKIIDYANIDYYKEQKKESSKIVDNVKEKTSTQQPVNESLQRIDKGNKTAAEKDKFDIRIHSTETIKSYNNKHYYLSNQLRLVQCGILFGIMLLEIVACFYFIEVLHNGLNITRFNRALYIVAVVLAAFFPIESIFMASTNYYKRKRINYSGKSSAIFSVVVTILLCLIIFFLNIYGGILIKEIDSFLSSLILPMILSTNVIVNAIVFHCLYKSGKYIVD